MTGARRLASTIGAAVLVAGCLAGCTSAKSVARAGACLDGSTTAAAPSARGPAAAPKAQAQSGSGARLPTVALDCLDGSGAVRLASITRPTVISFWAAWCAPCRTELPQVEAFARAAGAGIDVIGVDTADTASSGRAMVHDFGLTYPMFSDPDKTLFNRVGGQALPTTIFVAPGGRVAYTYALPEPLTQAKIDDLARRYLGVTIQE